MGVFQRTARRGQLIYAFVRAPGIKPRLECVRIAHQAFDREWLALIKRKVD